MGNEEVVCPYGELVLQAVFERGIAGNPFEKAAKVLCR